MRLTQLQTGAKILGAFAVVSFLIFLLASVALWRMQSNDALATDLVHDKLAKQRLVAELLGLERLNGSRTVAIARSDSLELADYFGAQLAQGRQAAAGLEAALDALPRSATEASLIATANRQQAALAKLQAALFQAKEFGRTGVVEELVSGDWARGYAARIGALDALLAHETAQAHRLAEESATASRFGKALVLALGLGALGVGALLAWVLTRNIVGPLQQAVSLAEQVAHGDLRPLIRHARRDEIGRLFDALNGMTGGVSATVAQVLAGARAIDSASCEIADGNQDLSRRTVRQASNLRQTVDAMGELQDAIARNSSSARSANALAQSASDVAARSAQAVEQVVARMRAIKASSDRITDIAGMIDSIAFQTNILALNAAVEAARAGSEGRGFAVVAAEVRSLARHSATAAREIKGLLHQSSEEIAAGTDIAGTAGETMRAVLEQVQDVAGLLDTIASASAAQAGGVVQVGQAIAEMDESTRQNAAMVEQAASAAESMRRQTAELSELVATFKLRTVAAPGPRATGAESAARLPFAAIRC